MAFCGHITGAIAMTKVEKVLSVITHEGQYAGEVHQKCCALFPETFIGKWYVSPILHTLLSRGAIVREDYKYYLESPRAYKTRNALDTIDSSWPDWVKVLYRQAVR